MDPLTLTLAGVLIGTALLAALAGLFAARRPRRRAAKSLSAIDFVRNTLFDRLRRRELIRVPSFAFPLTQEQIGDYLGLTLVHVNRTLRALREQGLLSITRQMVSIPDPNRLRALVQGSPESAAELYDPIPTVDQV